MEDELDFISSQLDLKSDDTTETPTDVDAQVTEQEAGTEDITDPTPSGEGSQKDKSDKPTDQPTDAAKTRGPQDLTLPDGQIVKSGAQRRVYEKQAYEAYRARPQLEGKIRELEGQVQSFQAAFQAQSELGLTPDEAVLGSKLIAGWKRDPVGTAKYLLTELQAMGHTIEGVGVGTDVDALSKLIDQKLAPITSRFEEQTQQADAVQQAQQEWQAFTAQNPLALVHEPEITQLLERSDLSLQAAYLYVENWYLKNGLDFNKPLAEQQRTNGQTGQQDATRTTLPSGRGTASGAGAVAEETIEYAGIDDDYATIVKRAMKNQGLAVPD